MCIMSEEEVGSDVVEEIGAIFSQLAIELYDKIRSVIHTPQDALLAYHSLSRYAPIDSKYLYL